MNSAVTILLATDDSAVTDLFRDRAAKDPAVNLEFTSDGIGLAELAQEVSPDAIICAASLNGLDGLELCRQLKQDPDLRAIRLAWTIS